MVQTKIASSGFHIFKNTVWKNVKTGWESSLKIETNEPSKKIDTHCCAIKALIFGKLETVGHIPREVSRHVFLLIGEEVGRVDSFVLQTRYSHSPIPGGGLKITLMLTFRS